MYSNHTSYIIHHISAYTLRGRILVMILRILYWFVSIFYGKKWQKPPLDFEENPAFYTFKDVVFLGYKYYFCPPSEFSKEIISHFKNQQLDFSPPANFTAQTQITISAGGDLMPYEWIQKKYTKHLWDEIGTFFFDNDIVFANLETPINLAHPPSYVPEVMLSDMLFNADEEMFDIFNGITTPSPSFKGGELIATSPSSFKGGEFITPLLPKEGLGVVFKGFDVLSTANNHSLDMGEEGVLSTIDFLENKQIKHTGTSKNKENKQNFPIIERKGIKVAFIAYTYSMNKFQDIKNKEYLVNHIRVNHAQCTETDILPIIEDVALAYIRGADLVILSLHTGNAYQALPSAHTIKIYHQIFEKTGVDIILGSHPHNPQPMEQYNFFCPIKKINKKGFCIYSLADFVAYDIFVWDRLIPLLQLTIQKGTLTSTINGILITIPHTQLTNVLLKPIYNWGTKNVKKDTNIVGREMRFLDLKQTLQLVQNNQKPAFMTDKCVQELYLLNDFYEKYLHLD